MMLRSVERVVGYVLVVMLGLTLSSAAWGQSKPEPAAVAFDLKMSELLKSDLGQMLPLDQMGPPNSAFPDMISQAESLRGVITMPGEVEDFLFMQGESLPVDVYVELKFKAGSAAVEALKDFEEEMKPQSNVREEGGLRYYSPRSEANISLIFGLPEKLVFLTDSYQHDSANFGNVSPAIKEAMAKAAGPANIFLDFDQARPLIKSAIAFGKPQLPPAAVPFLEIPTQISLLQLAGNPGQEPALALTVTSPDEESAEMLRETMQGLVGMGKLAVQGMNPNDPQAKIMTQVLGQLKPTVAGKVVTMSLSKIEGLEDLLR